MSTSITQDRFVNVTYPNGESEEIDILSNSLVKIKSLVGTTKPLTSVTYSTEAQFTYRTVNFGGNYGWSVATLFDGKPVCKKYYSPQRYLLAEEYFDNEGKLHGAYYQNYPHTDITKFVTTFEHGQRMKDEFFDKQGKTVATFIHKDDESRKNIKALVDHFIAEKTYG